MKHVLLTLCLFLLACNPTKVDATPLDVNESFEIIKPINSTPVNETSTDPCNNISCGSFEVCDNANCICSDSAKKCGDKCISKDSCCKNKDCEEGEDCIDNKCVFSCDNLECEANKFCSASLQRCVCKSDYYWCAKQNSCVKRGSCCSNFDCPSDSSCLEYAQSAYVCLEGTTKSCKFIGLRPKLLSVDSKNVDVRIDSFFYKDNVSIDVDGQKMVIQAGQRKALNNSLTLFVERIKEFGGECRDNLADND